MYTLSTGHTLDEEQLPRETTQRHSYLSNVGVVTKGFRVRGSWFAILSRGDWFTKPEMRTRRDFMAMGLSNAMICMPPWYLRCVLDWSSSESEIITLYSISEEVYLVLALYKYALLYISIWFRFEPWFEDLKRSTVCTLISERENIWKHQQISRHNRTPKVSEWVSEWVGEWVGDGWNETDVSETESGTTKESSKCTQWPRGN